MEIGTIAGAGSTPWIVPSIMAAKWRVHGFDEQPLIHWVQQFVRPNSVVVDAGAHIGSYAISLAPLARIVHAFEAQQRTYYALCGNAALHERMNVVTHHVALSDSAGTVTLRVATEDGGGTSLHELPDRIVTRTESVGAQPLDDFQLEDVSFMKLDVEGEELALLRGARKTIDRCRPFILFEAWEHDWFAKQRAELLAFFKEVNYTVSPVRGWHQQYIAAPI